jgi:hypothetical protein
MSINIEEERVAFEKLCYPNAASILFYEGKYHRKFNSDWQFKTSEHANHLFRAWVIAKEHAAEMAKPTCEVYENMQDRWVVVKYGTLNKVCENGSTFDCESDALAFAKERGYRVIEE